MGRGLPRVPSSSIQEAISFLTPVTSPPPGTDQNGEIL